MTIDSWAGILGAFFQGVTALAVVLAAAQVSFHARAIHRDLEMEYVRQYWEILHRASDEWRMTFL